jgi:hypothetical protein
LSLCDWSSDVCSSDLVRVRKGRYSVEWTLQCGMDVTVRNGRYGAQWTYYAIDVTVRNGRYSAHRHRKDKHFLFIKQHVCVCLCG